MKRKAMAQLLEIGYNIFRMQRALKNWFEVDHELFAKELKLIFEVIMIDMGIMKVCGEAVFIVNTDHYEFLEEKLMGYYKGEIPAEKMMDFIQALRTEDVYYIINGGTYTRDQSIDMVNKLFDLKYLIQSKRKQWSLLDGSITHSISMEKKILSIALEELGDQRYFKKKIT